jgi:hypothetical protein
MHLYGRSFAIGKYSFELVDADYTEYEIGKD